MQRWPIYWHFPPDDREHLTPQRVAFAYASTQRTSAYEAMFRFAPLSFFRRRRSTVSSFSRQMMEASGFRQTETLAHCMISCR